MAVEASEFERLGAHIQQARRGLGLSQADLAGRASLSQAEISYFESGRRRPSLDQLLRIAKALDVSLQWLLTGSDRAGESLAGIAIELRQLGIVDLWVKGAVVPGAFRRPEEVIALALSAREPDPRVVEAIPAVLAWNEINPTLLRAYGAVTRTTARIAWLADVALAIERGGGFPGGCRKEPLERFLASLEKAGKRSVAPAWDDLGKPASGPPTSPIWKRWHIRYDASLGEFEERAGHLRRLRTAQNLRIIVRARVKKKAGERAAGDPIDFPGTRAATGRPTSKVQKPRKENGPGRS
jgi:transcriptional regulator with XRE-family HTH domain